MSSNPTLRILLAVKDVLNHEALITLLKLLPKDKAEIYVLHVLEFPFHTSLYDELVQPYIDEAKKKFSELVKWIEMEGFNVQLRVVASRDIAEAILSEAENLDANIVVLQKTLKKFRRRVRKVLRWTNLERVIDTSKRIVIIFPEV
ncbi:MAG: universal stress protein [Nitrososphaerota archaeon]|nr:universal stress protein [Candidatus Geocrenenecus dongiae]